MESKQSNENTNRRVGLLQSDQSKFRNYSQLALLPRVARGDNVAIRIVYSVDIYNLTIMDLAYACYATPRYVRPPVV